MSRHNRSEMRICKKHGLWEFVCTRGDRYRCKQCMSDSIARCRLARKRKLILLCGGKCELCGYDRSMTALHFHHIDPKEKSVKISYSCTSRSFEDTLAEASKCLLLCSNCHGEVEEGVTELPLKLVEARLRKPFDSSSLAALGIPMKDRARTVYWQVCPFCGKDFETLSRPSKFCSVQCRGMGQRKVERPSRKELAKDVLRLSWGAIGRKYGVTHKAVQKWAEQYGLNA